MIWGILPLDHKIAAAAPVIITSFKATTTKQRKDKRMTEDGRGGKEE